MSDLNVTKWSIELQDDVDRSYLMDGIANGFSIVDTEIVGKKVDTNNHMSCMTSNNKPKVEQLLRSEIINGHYVPVKIKPDICSPLAAIEKSDGSVRLLHDASRPTDYALNDYSESNVSVKYQSVKDALDLILPGSYICKIDLKSAYRSVGIKPSQYHMSGVKWKFSGDNDVTYLVDTRLMMGASKAPSIFHRLTQAVKRCMEKRGYHLVVYLDDFLLIANDYDTCLQGQHTLIALLRDLGFSIAWNKVEGPTKKLVFLGVEIDTENMTIGLPENKVADLLLVLKAFQLKKRASCKQLQSLAGKLNWACNVIKCGRGYIRNIINTIAPLRLANHKARITKVVQDDIQWWITVLGFFPGKSIFYKPHVNVVQFDACNKGAGYTYLDDWGYLDWKCDIPQVADYHINCKETIASIFACRRWAHLWRDSKVLFVTDNVTAKSCISKGTCKNPQLLPWIRELHAYSVLYNFDIEACWIPGITNVIPDAISRLRYPNLRRWFMSQIGIDNFDVRCAHRLMYHMSNASLISIVARDSDVAKVTR